MKPEPHAGQTSILGAPADWDEKKNGPCEGLPVTRHEGAFYSVWSLSWRERFKLLIGRPVRLVVFSKCHPPVWLDIVDLPNWKPEKETA